MHFALAAFFDALLFFLGAALLVAAVRWWRPEVPVRAGLAYGALVAAFFAVPLFTGAVQLPTDVAYRWLPWRDTVRERVVPQNALLTDILLEQLPFHTLVRQRLLTLEAPLWTHEIGTGQPLLANAQSGPFAPLHLMALPLPPSRALTVSVAWEILLLLLLMHALLLRLGAGPTGSSFGAVAAGFSSYMTAWSYYPLAMAAAWIPGVLLGLVLLRHGERRSFAGLVACGLGLAAGGNPETLAYAALAATFTAIALLMDPSPGRVRFARRLLAAGALTACLAAPLLLPVLEQVPRSERSQQVRLNADRMQPVPFEARMVLPVLDPLGLGSPRDANWDGPSNFNEVCSGYAGLVTLAAAVAGALVFRGRVAVILATGLAALLAALRVFPFYDALRALPLIGEAAHGRLRYFWVLAVALAGGLSVGRLAEDRRARSVTAVALTAAAVALALGPPARGAGWQTSWWIAVLGGIAVSLMALWSAGSRRSFAQVAIAALAVDLFLLGIRYQPVPPAGRGLFAPAALAFLIERERGAAEPFRVVGDGDELHPNLAPLFGLWDPRHSDPMHPFAAGRFVSRRLKPGGQGLRASTETYLAVRYKLTRRSRRLPPPWRPVFNGVGGRVWENPRALPLFFVPRRFLWTTEREVVARTLSWRAIRDFRHLAVAVGEGGPAVQQEGAVRGIRPGSNRFDLKVESGAGAIVVSSVSYDPGWRAEAGGRSLPVHQVNSGFLGFRVPPGAHAVSVIYRPAGWTLGLAVFVLGISSLLAVGVWRRLAIRL